ncbi:MAG: hypothetical protein ABW022_03915 [Actinoplanes sp.]
MPPPVVSPAMRSGLIVGDLLHDGVAQSELRRLVADHDIVRLVMMGPSPGDRARCRAWWPSTAG